MTPLRETHDLGPGHATRPQTCRIRVRFDDPPIELSYQDDRAVAARFALAAAALGLHVTLDQQPHRDLPALPCRGLWT
ncbi:hypothetical protein [Nocardia cyriacigeorgica]|uniref:hypothetical protein n=1 Tax=Nocardia cyriacigeorgica TaxID=135487 RepID=UPI002453CC8C|nr:hypothetical protein [Nocardia cyriacigeorgica]